MDVTKPSLSGTPPGVPGRRPAAIGGLRRDDRFARRVALRWRRLTGNGEARTLVACSGGADSTALLLALALATRELVVAHVVHDLRPREEAEGDRDAARAVAMGLGLRFVEAEVHAASLPGNVEARARRARYEALARLAREQGCSFVATAHHADDQLETLLMALLRGSGPRGLRGIAPARALDDARGSGRVMLIRPMLGCTRAEARAACGTAGITWREDRTNADTSRMRAAIRADVLPLLTALRPESPRRAARAAELLRDAAVIVDERVKGVFGDGLEWRRGEIRGQPGLIIGEGLRRAALRLLGGRHADRLSSRLLDDAVRAIGDDSTEPREFHWPGGVVVQVDAHRVIVSRS